MYARFHMQYLCVALLCYRNWALRVGLSCILLGMVRCAISCVTSVTNSYCFKTVSVSNKTLNDPECFMDVFTKHAYKSCFLRGPLDLHTQTQHIVFKLYSWLWMCWLRKSQPSVGKKSQRTLRKHSLESRNRSTAYLISFLYMHTYLVSDLISALFFLIHERLLYKCYISLIQLQQLLICIFGKRNNFQHHQTEELYVHALRHMTALYLMLLMYNTNDQKMACIMPVVLGEEMCSISDLQTSQKLIVLCYTFIFSFHVRCLFELNKKHMKKKKEMHYKIYWAYILKYCQISIYMNRQEGFWKVWWSLASQWQHYIVAWTSRRTTKITKWIISISEQP